MKKRTQPMPGNPQGYWGKHMLRYFSRVNGKGITAGIVALGITPEDVCADIGTGPGDGAARMADTAGYVYGIDTSGLAIQEAEKRYGQRSNITFAHHDGERLPFEDDSLDCILLSHLIYFFKEKELVVFIRELHRVLRKDGRISVVIGNPWQMWLLGMWPIRGFYIRRIGKVQQLFKDGEFHIEVSFRKIRFPIGIFHILVFKKIT